IGFALGALLTLPIDQPDRAATEPADVLRRPAPERFVSGLYSQLTEYGGRLYAVTVEKVEVTSRHQDSVVTSIKGTLTLRVDRTIYGEAHGRFSWPFEWSRGHTPLNEWEDTSCWGSQPFPNVGMRLIALLMPEEEAKRHFLAPHDQDTTVMVWGLP